MAATPKFQEKETYLKFRRPENNCLLCSAPIHGDGHHPSLLRVSDKEEVIRNDFCAKCWTGLEDRDYFSYWVTTRIQAPTSEERRLLRSERNEALYRLFAALYDSETHDVAPQLFLLAHLLLRYKVLVFRGPTEDGRLLFVHPKLDIAFLIEDLPLDAVDFVKIKEQVEREAVDYAPSNQKPGEEDGAQVVLDLPTGEAQAG